MVNLRKRAVVLLVPLLLPGACSWFRDKPPEYLGSQEARPLEVPQGLDPPRYSAPLLIASPEMRLPSGDELNPGPPRAVSTGGSGETNAYMAWSAQGVYLQVRDTPKSVARRLGFAIERSGMKLLERNEDGSHRFEYVHLRYDDRSFWQKLMFWRNDSGPNYSGVYRARIEPDGENARVYLYFDSGKQATTNAAEHVLGIFMERLG